MKPTPEALLRRVEWTVLRRLDGLLQGDYRTLWRGFGIDLADLREYQYHDDVRHIDWNVTARLQTPYVRQFTEDRELSAWFVVDLTASMQFGSGDIRKIDLAIEHIALLSRLLTRHGNRIGALLYTGGDAVSLVPLGSGRRQVLQLISSLQQAEPQKNTPTDLNLLFARAAALIKRRSLIFTCSDFLGSSSPWHKSIGQLAQRHEVIALKVQDPLETELPDLGMLALQDSETGEQILVDTNDAKFRQRLSSLAQARAAQTDQYLLKAGVDSLIAKDAEALIAFVAARKKRKSIKRQAA